MAITDPDAPSAAECTDAMARALRRQLGSHHTDFPKVSRAYLEEQVTAVAMRPEPQRDGWWLIGIIFDYLQDSEFNVWYRPRGLAVSQRQQPVLEFHPPQMCAEPDPAFRSYETSRK